MRFLTERTIRAFFSRRAMLAGLLLFSGAGDDGRQRLAEPAARPLRELYSPMTNAAVRRHDFFGGR